jgi:hypothetical protein
MMRAANGLWSVGSICVALAVGCGGKQAEPAAAAAAPTPPAASPVPAEPVAAVPPSAAPSSIEEASFALRLAEAGPYKAGELGRVVLQLEPRGKFHINQEYPVEIAVSGTADTNFPKSTLMRPDAAEFGEKKARFEVPFTANTTGDHKLLANVKFAVCTAENCVPDERNLALALAVN